MKNKKLFVSLIALATIVIAITYTLMNMDAGKANKPRGNQPANKDNSRVEVDRSTTSAKPPRNLPAQTEKDRNNNASETQADATKRNSDNSQAQVGVYNVSAASYHAVVKGYGEVQPVDSLSLIAQVNGQIDKIAANFKTGALVKAGETLAFINKTPYLKALASAQSDYQAAVVSLEEERLLGIQTRDEWNRSGLDGDPASDLVLRAPQLKAAQAALEKARQSVASATRDVALTEVTAPFDALVISREVSPGSYIQAGGAVAKLYSVDSAEIAIGLSPSQWTLLPSYTSQGKLGWPVNLLDASTNSHWQANVSRVELHQDMTTRQRNVIVSLNKPLTQQPPLLLGSFVSAQIQGIKLDNIWKIPASAISQKQEVWFISPNNNTLQKFTPNLLFENKGFAFISPYQQLNSALIVSRPLNSYLANTRVQAVIEATTGESNND